MLALQPRKPGALNLRLVQGELRTQLNHLILGRPCDDRVYKANAVARRLLRLIAETADPNIWRFHMKMLLTCLLLGSSFSHAMAARNEGLTDFTKEQCRSSNSHDVFQCPDYVNECEIAAIKKIEYKAAAQRAILITDSLKVTEVDDRFYNPSKYVWFSAQAKLEDGSVIEIGALTQKSYLPEKECF